MTHSCTYKLSGDVVAELTELRRDPETGLVKFMAWYVRSQESFYGSVTLVQVPGTGFKALSSLRAGQASWTAAALDRLVEFCNREWRVEHKDFFHREDTKVSVEGEATWQV